MTCSVWFLRSLPIWPCCYKEMRIQITIFAAGWRDAGWCSSTRACWPCNHCSRLEDRQISWQTMKQLPGGCRLNSCPPHPPAGGRDPSRPRLRALHLDPISLHFNVQVKPVGQILETFYIQSSGLKSLSHEGILVVYLLQKHHQSIQMWAYDHAEHEMTNSSQLNWGLS